MELLFDGWETLPIAKYQEIARLTERATKELEALDKEANDYNTQRGDALLNLDLDIVASLYGITRQELEDMPYTEVMEMSEATRWINEMPNADDR